MSLEYWFMFPIAMVIATIAMASGVEGATFFTPLFILGLGLPAEVAIGVGLITEVFGFTSGVMSYVKKKLIDYGLGLRMLMVTVPLALAGTLLAGYVPGEVLKIMLGIGLIAIASTFLKTPDHEKVQILDNDIQRRNQETAPRTTLVTAEGEEISYTVCNRVEGGMLGAVGALFIGMLSTGLGEMNGYFFLRRCRVPSKVSVATSVFIVAITALVASLGHVFTFVQSGPQTLMLVGSIVVFTIPGVLIGGQLGPRVAASVSPRLLEVMMAVLFVMVAALMLATTVISMKG